MPKQFISLISALFILSSCSSLVRKEQKNIQSLLKQKKIDEALSFLEKSKIKKEKGNRLLYMMESSRLKFLKGDYEKACKDFYNSNELADKLFTKKVLSEALSYIKSDNSKDFQGSIFERSMLYYYQAQCFFKLYQSGKIQVVELVKDNAGPTKEVISYKPMSTAKRKSYLQKARASVVAWDAFFSKIRRNHKYKTIYINDLLGKILGAKIHEAVGAKDRQITMQLYKDALKILNSQALTYSSYNEDFKKLARSLKSNLKKKKYSFDKKKVKTTAQWQQLKNWLDYKVLKMTYNIRRGSYNREVKRLKPSKEVIEKLKKNKKTKTNVTFIFEEGLVSPTVAHKFDYSLESAYKNSKNDAVKALIAGVGLPLVTHFMMGPLGLGISHRSRSGNSVLYMHHDAGQSLAAKAGIQFEMPIVKERKKEAVKSLVIYKVEKGGTQKKVYEKPLIVIAPLSDISSLAAVEKAEASYTRVGIRVAAKHLVAILAAYKTYELMKKDNGEFIAKMAAASQYLISARGIEESEKADTRFWSSLPDRVMLKELFLSEGNYQVFLSDPKTKTKGLDLGPLVIGKQKKNIFTYQI